MDSVFVNLPTCQNWKPPKSILTFLHFLVVLWSKMASKPGAYVPPRVPKPKKWALKKIHVR